MRINLMTSYAIKTIKSIALNERGIVTSNSISEEQGIPHGVLMKVLRILRVNDIVSSHQGRGEISGGYSMRISVNEITLLDVIEIMEGPIDLIFNTENRARNNLNQGSYIQQSFNQTDGIEMEYLRISGVIREELKRYTIGELIASEMYR